MSAASTYARPLRTSVRRAPRIALEQLTVAGGQIAAGVGNLAFALVLARVLEPAAFADIAAFLALYLLLHVPAGSLSAGTALTPSLETVGGRRRILILGAAVGAALAGATPVLAPLIGLPAGVLFALAAAAPGAGLLALERGRLYGLGRSRRAVASLLAEPAVRLTAGVALAAVAGPVGAAAAVAAAGYAALAVATLRRRQVERAVESRPSESRERIGPAGATVLAFLLLAIVQNQDVLLANTLLPAHEAARFAVLSTLGGAAAFATTTIPLVLMRRSVARERGALTGALGVAALLGAAAVAVVALAPAEVIGAAFGDRYADVGEIAVPYLVAMALLGLARVFIAHACARRGVGGPIVLLVAAVAAQAALVLAFAQDATGVARVTFAVTAALAVGTASATVLPFPRVRAARPRALRLPRVRPVPRVAFAVGLLTLGGLGLRLLATRGIWVDEAITIHQAQLPLGDMLRDMRATDVHPPLHHLAVWGSVRAFGTSELAVRVPSLIAGTALIPLLYVAGRDIYDRRAGIAAATFGAVAPFAIWYSDEARMYAPFMLFALVAVWAQVRAVRHGRVLDWLLYAGATAALLWNQYFAVFLVGVQQLGFAAVAWQRFRQRERPLRLLAGWAGALALVAVALIPLVPLALDQFGANEAAGKGLDAPSQAGSGVTERPSGPSIYGVLTNFVWLLWGYHSDSTMLLISAVWPLVILLGLVLLGRGRSGRTTLLVAGVVVPALGLFALGQVKPFLFEARYFIGALPLLLLLVARAATTWPRTRLAVAVVVAALTASMAVGFADQQLNGSNPRVYDFKGALAEVRADARPGDVLIFSPPYLDKVVDYYAGGIEAHPLRDGVPGPRSGGRVFVLASFLDKPQFGAETGTALTKLRRGRKLTQRDELPQIRLWEFQ